ncbi:hypothetical protein [Pedobacter aquatilis]|uniref:hypothetical protein n=1 Tax=Pedobacter aquatilis TaxID=351343 RepID=UPI00292D88A5|nr:hypothetical protein [Pedobacter aquatilis]
MVETKQKEEENFEILNENIFAFVNMVKQQSYTKLQAIHQNYSKLLKITNLAPLSI